MPAPTSHLAQSADRLQMLAALREIDWEQYLRDTSDDTSSLSFLSGLGLGAIIGIVVAILLAPQPGRRVREQVWHTGIELGQRGSRLRHGYSAAGSNNDDTLADEAERAEVDLMRRLANSDER